MLVTVTDCAEFNVTAGTVKVTEVLDDDVTVALVPPTLTVGVPLLGFKPVPVIVTESPTPPSVLLNDVIAGAAHTVNVTVVFELPAGFNT